VGDEMNKIKSFNMFVFLSTLARSLIDCFIPIILYKKGLNVDAVLFYLILNYSMSFLLNVPLTYISQRITFKWAMIITSFFIGIAYYFLLLKDVSILTIFLFALTHIINTHTYWVSRHYYALEVLPKRNLADEVGNIIILTSLALIPVSYIGALMMNKLDMEFILAIVILIYMISIIPLFFIKERKRDSNTKIINGIKETLGDLPQKSFLFMLFAQFRMISRYLFPLYLFLYVQKNYEYIGIFNIAVGVASMFFIYFFARKMDRDKKDYLILSGILGAIVYFLKLNITDTGFMLLIGLAEGLIDKMYEVAFNRNLYALGHHYDGVFYASGMEGLQNFSRIVITLIFVFLIQDIKLILYLCAFMLVITGLIGFDDGEGGY
jgi:hypothetical protein